MAKSKGILGIDIGSSAVKLVELKESKKGYKLTALGMVYIPPETIVDGAVMNAPVLSEKIQELMAQQKGKVKDCVSAVSGHAVILKKVPFPASITDEELAEEIKIEAGNYIPHDLDEVYMDYARLDPAGGGDQAEVILAAVKRDHMNEYINVLKDAGLNPVIMDISAFALENMFETNYDADGAEVLALVNIGASITNLNIVRGGASLFTRDMNVGGEMYTEEIQKALNVSYEEATAMKMGGDDTGAGDEVIPQEVSDIIRSVSEQIAGEVTKSLDFFMTTSADTSISKIYLTGGCSRLQGLDKVIEDKTGYPVELINPFNRIEASAKQFPADELAKMAPSMAIAVGLALRRPGDKWA